MKTSLTFIALIFLAACSAHTDTLSAQSNPPPVAPSETQFASLQETYNESPDNSRNMRQYSDALMAQEKYDEAYAIALPLGDKDKPKLEDLKRLSHLSGKINNADEQIEWLEKIKAIEPANFDNQITLAKLYKKEGQQDKANEIYKNGFANKKLSTKERQDFLDLYMIELINTKTHDEAFNFLTEAQEKQPNNKAIEKNLRIIRALMQSYGHSAPKPEDKPKQLKTASIPQAEQ